MKIGVLGGTFDPIHYGHLLAAEEVRAQLALHYVLFVPAGRPPHKLGRPITPAVHRLAMVELAIAGNPHFLLSRVDVDRPGPSYSVDMLGALQREWDGAELVFIIGLDSLGDLLTWHDPARLLKLCRIAAVSRPGCEYDLAALEAAIPRARERIDLVAMPEMDISSTDLRRRVAEGRPITYQVPPAVERYIHNQQLYRLTRPPHGC